jgi:hypothetical protein
MNASRDHSLASTISPWRLASPRSTVEVQFKDERLNFLAVKVGGTVLTVEVTRLVCIDVEVQFKDESLMRCCHALSLHTLPSSRPTTNH